MLAPISVPPDIFSLTSPFFKEGDPIPARFTCKGKNINPELLIAGIPEDAKTLALIMHDPDAPSGDFKHWVMWNIPANADTIAENSVPLGASEGTTSFDATKYGGPCPPSGTHHYIFELYALDTSLDLPAVTTADDLRKAMEGHILGETKLTGTFSAD